MVAFELSCQGSTVQKGIIYNRAFGYDTCARLGFKSQVIVRVYARVSAMHMAIGDTGGRGLGPRPRSRARLGWSRSHTESWEAD